MLERSFDAARINAVVNHPDVRPFVGPEDLGELDLAPVAARPEHWFLMGDHGGFLLSWSAPGVREVHTFILPAGRGRWAVEARKAMLEYAAQNGTKQLWTKVLPEHRHVDRFARQGGMQLTDEMVETFGALYRVYSMELGECLSQQQ